MSLVNTYEPAAPCNRDGLATCLHLLAAGQNTNVGELCPGCTQRVMTALEWIASDELPWHPNWQERARTNDEQETKP